MDMLPTSICGQVTVVTSPSLELCAPKLLATCAATIQQQTAETRVAGSDSLLTAWTAEELDLHALTRRLWTDSVTVISLLNSITCRYHAYVANPVTTVHEKSAIDE